MMKSAFKGALLVLCWAMLLNVAAAQGIDCLGQACPNKAMRDDYSKRITAIVVKDKSPVYASPAKNSAVSGKQNFGARLLVYMESSDYTLVGTVDREGTLLGWMSNADLLCDKEALKINYVYEKALPNNNVSAGNFAQQASFRTGPGDDYPVRFNGDIWKIWFIYKRENGYVLLGSDQFVYDDQSWNKDQRLIGGWVKQEECFFWKTRFALNFYKENAGKRNKTLLFSSEDGLKRYYESGGTDESDVILDESDQPFNYLDPRIIMLTPKTMPSRLSEDGELRYFHVAFPGKVVIKDTKEELDSSSVHENEALYQEMQSRSNDIDILFVMDHTSSMNDNFLAASKAVKKFVSHSVATLSDRVRFGLVTYQDYKGDAPQALVHFDDLESTDPEMFSAELNKASLSCGDTKNDRDYKEAVFNGLVSAVSDCRWREGSSRFVVLIGDHGDHANDQNRLTDAGGMPTAKVYDALKSKGIVLFAVQAPNRVNSQEGKEAYKAFKDQFERLIREYDYPAYFKSVSSQSQVTAQLEERLLAMTELVRLVVRAVDCSREGNPIKECLAAVAEEFQKEAVERQTVDYKSVVMEAVGQGHARQKWLAQIAGRMESSNVDPNQLRKTGEATQLGMFGWVAELDVNGKKQTELELLIKDRELSSFSTMLAQITQPQQGNHIPLVEAMNGLAVEQVKNKFGQDFVGDKALGDAIMANRGIPLRSPLLWDKRGVSVACAEDQSACERFQDSVGNSITLLRSVEQENLTRKTPAGVYEVVIENGTRVKRKWFWRSHYSVQDRFAWVPWSYFP